MTLSRLALRCALTAAVALVAASVALAGIPPALDEDRSQPGFCSPDCPLQQDATHSIAVAIALAPTGRPVEPAREQLGAAPTPAHRAAPASPDAPRAPPRHPLAPSR